MTGQEYDELVERSGAVDLVRPFWKAEDYHRKIWDEYPLTVLICQRQTRDATQLCIESLLRFYPNVKILVVDGRSQDSSTLYLQFMSLKYPNIRLWERDGTNSHGDTMHEAIMGYINTEYVLLMDSDVITMRHGMIEGMMDQFKKNDNLYATGNLMVVTRANDCCGIPLDEADAIRYAHPCLSIYHVPTYKMLERSTDHGSPFCYNMQDAERKGLDIGSYPVDKYSVHISGSSWQAINSVWNDDYDTPIRPLITFIVTNGSQVESLKNQKDKDFNIVIEGALIDKMVSIHGIPDPHVRVQNKLFNIRFKLNGHYVCYLPEHEMGFDDHLVRKIKLAIIEQKVPTELVVDDLTIVERKRFQYHNAIGI